MPLRGQNLPTVELISPMSSDPDLLEEFAEAHAVVEAAKRPIVANELVEVVAERIRSFVVNLGEGEKLVIVLDTGGLLTPETFHALGRGVIEIVGRDDLGRSCSLLQHLSQLRLVLRAAKLDSGEERKPIGFD